MLTNCPECELQVSDKAINCPHCGYPLKNFSEKCPPRKNSKYRRLPNGFGQISMIKNRNLRRPYRAMVTVGKDEHGRPICKLLKPQAYFETYNDAYKALVEYNKKPYDPDQTMTVEELFEVWSKQHFKTLNAETSVRNVKSAWKASSAIKDELVTELRPRHIKYLIDNAKPTMQLSIKSLFNQMLDYATEYEIVDKNVSRSFNISQSTIKEMKDTRIHHLSFSEDELKTLWKNINKPNVDMVLFQCYSGWRPQEIGMIEVENINTDTWIMIGGLKTEAGKDRLVPIHPCLREIVSKNIEIAKSISSKYLFNKIDMQDTKYTYDRYKKAFKSVVKDLGLDPQHKPHDGRKTFVTLCKQYKVDEYAIKYIVGHKIYDITEAVYTDRNPEWLMSEIEKIKSLSF